MGQPLRVLLVEDSADDAELVLRALRHGGFEPDFERVYGADELALALTGRRWDLVLSDWVMPGFDGRRALQLVVEQLPDVPFILVSGQLGDEVAVSMMKAGCADYVSKDNLTRLAPAIRRELREAEVRRERRHAQEALRFLAEASEAFASSLDYEETVRVAARRAVSTLADWCVIDVIEDGGTVRRLGVAHADPAKEALLQVLAERYPASPDAPNAGARVMQTGVPILVPLFDEAALARFTRDAAHADLLRQLGVRSGITVPLVVRGKILGAVTLASASRTYTAPDLATAEDFARRAALALENARLYWQAREAVADMQVALEGAQEAIRVRDDFLSVASHELKTPLTALKIQVGNLIRSNKDQRIEPALAAIRRQTDRMALLVDNLLDVSRHSIGGMEFEPAPMDLVEMARETIARFTDQLERADCQVRLVGPAPVCGSWDGARLEQVLINLLSNAMKFGAGRPIEVTVEDAGAVARIEVRDQGIGIAPEDTERIFDRFERAVSPGHYGGIGLGLAISRQIVEAHGGTIRAAGERGKGAVFTVELPLHREESSWAP